jgi:hypothetical protein
MKYIVIFFSTLIVLVIGWLIYFAIQFSSVYPPLEKYKFEMNINEFQTKLSELGKSENLNILMTNQTGNYPENYNQYFTILQGNTFKYRLKYNSEKSIPENENIEMELLGVFENKIGGYRKSDSDNIEQLIFKFETEILRKIKN